jgi:hypothetical protein
MPFKVRGPISLAVKTLSDDDSQISLRLVDRDKSRRRLINVPDGDKTGVYIFGLRRQGASAETPWYIGLTEKNSLAFEALHKDKIRKYARALIGADSGTPVLYFLIPETTKDKHRIDKLETFLIWLARQRNTGLLNKQKVRLTPESLHTYLTELRIHGILNSSTGNPGASKQLRAMIGWNRAMHREAGVA